MTSTRRFDWASMGIVVGFFGLLFHLRAQLPVFSDSWYHLSVIRAFAERGFTGEAWWEFAPVGRPHLYAPLFHLVNLGVMRVTGCELLDLARFDGVVTFPALLLAGWASARCWFGVRAAFVTVLLMALNIALLFPCSLIMMPGTWALMMWPFVLMLVLRDRWLGAGILLAVLGYTHFGMVMVAALSVAILWRRAAVLCLVVGAVLYSPWLVHLYRHREFLHSGVANLPVFVPALTVVAAGLGVVALVRKPEPGAWAVVAMMVASCVFLFTLRERFWTYGGFLWAVLGGYGVQRCAGKHFRVTVAVLAVSAATMTPFLCPMQMEFAIPVPARLPMMGTPLLTLAKWPEQQVVPEDMMALAKWVREKTGQNEVLLTEDRLLGECLFALTGRQTSCGLWGEVMTEELKGKLRVENRTWRGYIIINSDRANSLMGPVSAVAEFGKYLVVYRTG
ncbi:MAG: hypothetical protein WCS70_06690 [Verrucomicrobiota bacterium]